MPFTDEFRVFQSDIETILRDFFNQKMQAAVYRPIVSELLGMIRDLSLRGGKRLRPALLWGGHACFSAGVTEGVKIAGAACELMQSSLLIHDDIMDHAEVRRGGPSMHCAYEQFSEGDLTSDQSNAMAILAGDAAGYLGIELLGISGFPPAVVQKVTALYGQIMVDETYGQALDVYPRDIGVLKTADILDIYRYKTSRYTTEFPLMAGALLAGQDDTTVQLMLQIGKDLGIAFQIQDDVLGVFGDPAVTGKSDRSDLAEGKRTLLAVMTHEQATAEQREVFDTLFGRPDISQVQAEQLRQIMRETKALEQAGALAATYFREIRTVIGSASWRPEGKAWLLQLISLIELRTI